MVALGVLLVAGTSAAAADAHYRGGGKDCGSVSFQPNTDFGAFSIRASGVSCRKARAVARNRGPKPRRDRFSCHERVRDAGDRVSRLSHTDYHCMRGDAVVTFAIS